MAAIQTAGSCTIVVTPSGATATASNPEITVTGATVENNPVIMSTVGELAVASLSFVNGTWARAVA
jgi:hypothetical protein